MNNPFETINAPQEKIISFDDLMAALPEESRSEFEILGDEVFQRSMGKMGKEMSLNEGEEQKQLEELSPEEEQEVFKKYEELVEIAKSNIDKK